MDFKTKITLPFSAKDYPLGSYFYFFRKQKIRVDNKTRKSGERKFFWDYTYARCKVTHIVEGRFGLVGTEGDNSNEGFDPKEFRDGPHEGHFIIPEWLFLGIKGLQEPESVVQKLSIILNDGTGHGQLNHIVKTCKTENKMYGRQEVPWHRYNQSK
jgi:hypothetical protein